MNLRKLAAGQPCRVRLPEVCNRREDTTVLAHIKERWYGSLKPPDICGVHACFECHNEIDRRTQRLPDEVVRLALLGALCEQLIWYQSKGFLKW